MAANVFATQNTRGKRVDMQHSTLADAKHVIRKSRKHKGASYMLVYLLKYGSPVRPGLGKFPHADS
eukprot:40496-Pyramimonas_sp.AAC.1